MKFSWAIGDSNVSLYSDVDRVLALKLQYESLALSTGRDWKIPAKEDWRA
jgi:hypothetical protein